MTIDKVINEQKSRYEMLKKIPAHSINPDQVGFVALYEELATMLTDTNVAQLDNDINVVIKDNHQKNAPINCPLCDGEATVSTNEYESHYRAFVECPRCPCITSGIHQQKQYAISETIAKWNTRAKNTPAAAMSASTDTSASLNEQAEPSDVTERGNALEALFEKWYFARREEWLAIGVKIDDADANSMRDGFQAGYEAALLQPISAPPENGQTYNPATHILIAREDVPDGLENSVSNTKDFCFHEGTCQEEDIHTVWEVAALLAQKAAE